MVDVVGMAAPGEALVGEDVAQVDGPDRRGRRLHLAAMLLADLGPQRTPDSFEQTNQPAPGLIWHCTQPTRE